MIDIFDQAAKAPASISIMERSLFSERYCFVQVIGHYSRSLFFCVFFGPIKKLLSIILQQLRDLNSHHQMMAEAGSLTQGEFSILNRWQLSIWIESLKSFCWFNFSQVVHDADRARGPESGAGSYCLHWGPAPPQSSLLYLATTEVLGKDILCFAIIFFYN